MKKLTVLVLLVVGALSLASVDSMAERLPVSSQSVLVVEHLNDNYKVSKQTVLFDMVLNQLAIEQLIAQYVEMLAYNNGLDPKDIFRAFDGDFGLAAWVDSEGLDRVIAILGPISNPRTVKTAIEKLLPQLLPSDIKLSVAVDQEYLYIGDIEAYSMVGKGYNLSLVKSDLSPGFGYFYVDMGGTIQKGSVWNEEGILIAEVLSIPLFEESRERFHVALEGASVDDLEVTRHLPLVSGFARINDLSFLSELEFDGLGFVPLELEALRIGNVSFVDFSKDMTGEIMIDANISVDDIFSSLMGTQGAASDDSESVGYSYVVRTGYKGSIDDARSMIEKTDPDLQVLVSGDVLIVEGQYIWVQDGWLYVSSKNQIRTNEELQNGVVVSELKTYNKLLGFVGSDGFARLFIDSGYILTGLMGLEIESGVLINSEFIEDMGVIRSLVVIK
ncbi:hypothetical protein V511_06810 [Mesotoga sp. Brook.08.YT.4.2.5.1]|uniref:hypothetical protein n=1 Tax=unclassified Mesotoga TaxID=1184398 RepID=UPI000C1879C1|nr:MULTISPECIES: hypothetical protein [unclassified Mesotoga]PNE22656.1 hypothetical protein V511_06810 [Mesotoga sp. Brook.08.YT.4.2.5.1]PVD17698.1 hypothetical protein V512_012445 [Mesotoga sp. Brook.08.105.5.1]RAO95799.1 hypothetical protein M388_04710 [Mesotoga sp. Brook.08.YT.4.2.5.4.]RDI94164.1 hypothetical protein Q502_01405 [Mesotoga sp. Brook.08.YT.4.2.5.2.]